MEENDKNVPILLKIYQLKSDFIKNLEVNDIEDAKLIFTNWLEPTKFQFKKSKLNFFELIKQSKSSQYQVNKMETKIKKTMQMKIDYEQMKKT